MKYLKSIVVLSFLFGFPIGSWYFLQTGLDWRRVKAKEHTVKGPAVDTKLLSLDQASLLKTTLEGKTTIIKLSTTVTPLDESLKKQFKDAYTFQWLNDTPTAHLTNSAVTKGMDYVLIDTSLNIRQTYKGEDKETITRIVEDIALLLPHRKSRDIKMKPQVN